MALDDDFKAAAERSRSLPNQPPNVLLDMYALFKQGSAGDVTGKRPGMLDVRGRAKYDAWAKRKGESREQAMAAYIQFVDDLTTRHGVS